MWVNTLARGASGRPIWKVKCPDVKLLPLLVPCFLARTMPLLCPRRSMRRSTSEPAARLYPDGPCGRLYRWPAVSSRQPAAPTILHGLARRTAPTSSRHMTKGQRACSRSRPYGQVHLGGGPARRNGHTGGESHSGNEPGRSTCAGPGPLLPVSFAIRLTTAPPYSGSRASRFPPPKTHHVFDMYKLI